MPANGIIFYSFPKVVVKCRIFMEHTVHEIGSLPVYKISNHDQHLSNHETDKNGGTQTRLACRARSRLSCKPLGSDTNIALDQIQSFLNFVQTILHRIETDGLNLSRSDVLLLFALILNDGSSALMNFSDVSSTLQFYQNQIRGE